MDSKKTALYKNLKKAGTLELRELENLGVTRAYISKLSRNGFIERVGRGRYSLPSKESKNDALIRRLRESSIVKTKDLRKLGISPEYLRYFVNRGLITRLRRGYYTMPGSDYSAFASYAEISRQKPQAVICLLSALSYYNMTTQLPHEVWICIPRSSRTPVSPSLSLRVIRFSGESLTQGIEEVTIDGIRVKIFSPAKTVADCFKLRNKIGVDIAVEALRECLGKKLCSLNDIQKFAKIDRVEKVIQPYIEALL